MYKGVTLFHIMRRILAFVFVGLTVVGLYQWRRPTRRARHIAVDIIIPTVPRRPSYLDDLMTSLEPLTDARIVLFNSAQPPESHLRLLPWCKHHTCVSVPTTPPQDVQRALIYRTKTPTNEPEYLKWRTRENHVVRYAFQWVMTHRPAPHVIMLEDDVVALPNLTSFVPARIACLRVGSAYCGSVGYLFERDMIWTVLEKLYQYISTRPVDFIFEEAAGGRSFVSRQGLVRHIGRVSSSPNKNIRSQDETSI